MIKYYAIKEGNGVKDYITTSWEECKCLVYGGGTPVFKSFTTKEAAEEYLKTMTSAKVKRTQGYFEEFKGWNRNTKFGYLANPRRFLQKLGNYISHEVVTYDKGREKILRTVEELNNLDREDLAAKFYYKIHPSYLEGGYGSDMIDEIAKHIDYMIPKAYAKHYLKDHDRGPSRIEVNAEEYGLIYHYKHC